MSRRGREEKVEIILIFAFGRAHIACETIWGRYTDETTE